MQLVLQNMPIFVVFDSLLNRKALGQRLRKATSQLNNDAVKDPGAQGFVVLETSHRELSRGAVSEYFPTLPRMCFGVVLRSDPSYLILQDHVPSSMIEILKIAAIP